MKIAKFKILLLYYNQKMNMIFMMWNILNLIKTKNKLSMIMKKIKYKIKMNKK
jgi:hypothetical protein